MPRDIQLAEKVRLLRQFWRQERRAPTYAEMLDLFDYRSKNAVFGLLDRLEETGYVAKDANGRIALTSRAYPERGDSNGVAVFASGGAARVTTLTVWRMGSCLR